MHSQKRMNDSLKAPPAARAPRRSLQRSQVRWLLILGDLLLVNFAAWIALWLGVQRSAWWLAVASWDSFLVWFIFLSAIWFGLAQVFDLYDLRVAGSPKRAVGATLGAVLGTFGVYLVIYFAAAPQTLPRHLIVFFAVAAALLLALWRSAFAFALGAGPLARRVVVIGAGEGGGALLDVIRAHAPNYYHIVASFDSLEQNAQAARTVSRGEMDEVIVSAAADLDDEWLAALVAWREQGVQVVNLAAVYEELTGRVPVEHVGKTWSVLLPLEQDATRGLNGFIKRALDVLLASLALLVCAPFLPLLALAVRLDSRGAIFLRQTRVGQNGRVFTLHKFRSMYADAEAGGAQWAEPNDPRVTRVGKFLRRFKLDELPQLWNVLRGEMSLVGPRPERPEMVNHLQREIPFYRLRHVVRPGMTGWAAIRFRYGRSVDDALVKLQYDLYYIKHQSPLLDALILVRTLGAVLAPPRAQE